MEKVYFRQVGLGFTLTNSDNEADYVRHLPITIAGEEIIPGMMTTLSGFFKIPVLYAGQYFEHDNLMCFYLGEETDLLETKRYYDLYLKISDDRIFNKYKENSGRDFNFIKGRWK